MPIFTATLMGRVVGRVDQADQAREAQLVEAVVENRPRRLGPEPTPPVFPGQQVGNLDLRAPLDRPRKQAGAADELVRLPRRGRPQAEAVPAVEDRGERIQVVHRETPEGKALRLEYRRGTIEHCRRP
jgi:hypothetical protein